MDVAAIPFAVSFSDFIREAIEESKVMIALIGSGWQDRINEPDDPVRMEIEVAISNRIPILPVLIGNTAMPDRDELPESIAEVAAQNAVTVGVLHNFHTHMQSLLPKIESILGAMATQSAVTADSRIIQGACNGIVSYLIERYHQSGDPLEYPVDWRAIGTNDFHEINENIGSLFLHRITRLAELLELHFILSFWGLASDMEYVLSGWVISELERTPIIPDSHFNYWSENTALDLKIRRSDEDARHVWKMVTSEPLRLSLSYVATISPRGPEPGESRADNN